jgi:hypothetical protein
MSDDIAPTNGDVWSAVLRLVGRSRSLAALRSHRLHLIAARIWREERRPIPDELALQELAAIVQVRRAAEMLKTVSTIVDQEIIALKGMAVAECYPDPALRPFGDLDLIVADPVRAQRRLTAAGFRAVPGFAEGFFDGHHHLHPLELPDRTHIRVEVHSRAPWVNWCQSPSFADLRPRARPSGFPGIWYPERGDHALILCCHSWHSLPLRRLLDLVDIALVGDAVDSHALVDLARRRGVGKLWNLHRTTSNALLFDDEAPLALRLWARDLKAVRERSLIEHHMRLWFGPFSARAPHRAASEAVHAVGLDLRRTGAETWSEKLSRMRLGLQHPLRSVGEHDEALGPTARPLRPRVRSFTGPTDERKRHTARNR